MSVSTRSRWTVLALAIAAAAAAPAALSAQTDLPITVTVTTALSVSVDQSLAFGILTPGANRTIAASSEATAGRYQVSGTASASVNLSVVFPSCLRPAPGGGACTGLDPILDTFTAEWAPVASGGAHTALVGGGSTLTGTGTLASGTGLLFVFVGAKVTIPAGASAGAYTGNAVLTANY